MLRAILRAMLHRVSGPYICTLFNILSGFIIDLPGFYLG